MKKLLTILLFIPFLGNGQTIKQIYGGEYSSPMINSADKLAVATSNPAANGAGGGTPGIVVTINTPGVTFTQINNTLHGSAAIGSDLFAWTWGGNDQGQCGLGNLTAVITTATKVALDARGLPFTPIKIIQGSYYKASGVDDAQGLFFVKQGTLSDTVFYAGARKFGMGANGTAAKDTVSSPTIAWSLPSGRRVLKMVAAAVVCALLDDGTVYSWGANGIASYLGRSIVGLAYATPGQVVGFDDSIRIIAGGDRTGIMCWSKLKKLWHFGQYGGYAGFANNPVQATPTDVTDSVTSYMLNGTTRTDFLDIVANTVTFHYLTNDSMIFYHGDVATGCGGNGNQADLANIPGFPYNVDPAQILVFTQTHPVLASNKHNWKFMSRGALYCFNFFAIDALNQLYGCGRGKGGNMTDGFLECAGGGGTFEANYPDAKDRPWLTPLDPYAVASTAGYSCKTCKLTPGATDCSLCTGGIPSTVLTAIIAGGGTQSTSSSVFRPDGTPSTSVGTGARVFDYKWTGTDGVIEDPAAPKPKITGLAPGPHTYTLTVSDNGFNSASTNLVLTVTSIVNSIIGPIPVGSSIFVH